MALLTTYDTNPSLTKKMRNVGSLGKVSTATFASTANFYSITTSPISIGSITARFGTVSGGSLILKDLATSAEYTIIDTNSSAGLGSNTITFPIPVYFKSGFALKMTNITNLPSAATDCVIYNYY